MSREAIILAGGRGTRLQTVIQNIPKPMAPVGGKPFLTYLLDQLLEAGYARVVLSVGYRFEVIEAYFGSKYKRLDLVYAIEETPLGTGGGIKLALENVQAEEALIFNGDTFFDISISDFHQFHLLNGNDLSIVLRHVESTARYGLVICENDRIVGFQEKQSDAGSGLINGGIYLLNKKVFMQNTPEVNFSFETDFLQKLYKTCQFGGYLSNGYFVDIGIPEDYNKANAYFG